MNRALVTYREYINKKRAYTDEAAKHQLSKFHMVNNKVNINNRNYTVKDNTISKTLKNLLFKTQYQRITKKELEELRNKQKKTILDNYSQVKQIFKEATKIKLAAGSEFSLEIQSSIRNHLRILKIDNIKDFFYKSLSPICSLKVRQTIKEIMTSTKRKYKINGTIEALFLDVKQLDKDRLSQKSKNLLKSIEDTSYENTFMNKVSVSKIGKELVENNPKYLDDVDPFSDKNDSIFCKYYHHLKTFNLLNTNDINEFSEAMAEDIFQRLIEKSHLKGSGYSFVKALKIDIKLSIYDPLKGSGFIELPKQIADKKACINIKNEDKYCFRYCVECFMNKIFDKSNPERMFHYMKYKKMLDSDLNYEGVNFPASVEDIKHFESNNKHIGINVFELRKNEDNKTVVDIVKKSSNIKAENQIDLLFIEKDNNSHYVLIKNLDRLLQMQLNKNEHKQHICKYCFKNYYTLEKFQSSKCKTGECTNENIQQFVAPDQGKTIKFGDGKMDFFKLLKSPFYVVLDFEAFPETYEDNKATDKTKKYQKHLPCSFCLKVISPYEKYDEPPIIYTMQDENDDVMLRFFEELKRLEKRLLKILFQEHNPLKMQPHDIDDFKYATNCFYCNSEFTGENVKCRDHDHITGKYRAAACNTCNGKLKQKDFKIPIFCHNFKGYDSHFIISKANEYNYKNINVIASSSEKFLQLSIDKFDFKDSFSFLQCSLEKAIRLNKYNDKEINEKWKDNFKYMVKYAPQIFKERLNVDITDEMLDLLTEKGVYPYSYMNTFKRLEEELPTKEEFYNDLSLENISHDDYERAKKVYELFKCKNMRDYHDIYLLMDVLLLGDVFENFRNEMINHTGLDPCQFISMSHYAWNSQLRMTKCELGLIYNLDDFNTIERGKRGGITQVNKKYCKAYNKYLNNLDEKPTEQDKPNYLLYIDANNLYGKAMSFNLPYDSFEKLETPSTNEEILNYDFENDEFGYFDVVKLVYPKHLHKQHKDLPLAPVKKLVKETELSEYQKQLYQKVHKKKAKNETVSKLCLTLEDKDNYVVHRALLKFYLQQGLILDTVYETFKFHQKPFLKDYIDKNTAARNKRKDDFGKALYKLLNNAVFGKTMEDIKNRVRLDLVSDEKQYVKLVRDPKFKDVININEDLVAVMRQKEKVKLDKPIAIGVAILDLSKLIMYNMFYNVLKPFYRDNVELLYMDTDSFVLNVYTDDLYEDIKDEKLSSYFHNKILGCFKDELDGNVMSEFAALSPKMYSYKYNEKTEFRAKGVPKSIVKKTYAFDEYKTAILNETIKEVKFNTIQSKKHQIYTMEMTKTGLSPYESKRYWINNIESLPYGYQD